MRNAKNRLREFQEPYVDAFFTRSAYLTMLWGTGWYVLFLLWLFGDGGYAVHSAGTDAAYRWGLAVMRLTSTAGWVHLGLLALLILDGIQLFQERGRGSSARWASWMLAFGVLAICQGVTFGVGLLWRLNTAS